MYMSSLSPHPHQHLLFVVRLVTATLKDFDDNIGALICTPIGICSGPRLSALGTQVSKSTYLAGLS